MTVGQGFSPEIKRWLSRVGAAVLVLAVAVLWVDYARARLQAPRDAAAIATLQQQVQADRGAASALAAEQDRVTRTRQSRKRRSDALAIVAIAAAALFVAGRKWEMAGIVRPEGLTHIKVGRGFSPDGHTVGQDRSPDNQKMGQGFGPDIIDLSPVDQLISLHGRSKEAAIPILQGIQAHYRYLPDEALRRVCELTDVTPGQLAGTSTFYARFRRSPVGDHVIRVCHGTACHVSGARQITEELRRHLHIPDGSDTDPARRFTIDEVACIGCCSLAPVMMVDEDTAGRLTPTTAVAALDLAREREPA